MAAPPATYRYGPTGLGLEVPAAPPRPVLVPSASPGAVIRKGMRALWDQEPVLELTRRQLQSEAIRAGIAGRTGTYAQAAQQTGFAAALQQLAGPREVGPLARAYERAWGRPISDGSLF